MVNYQPQLVDAGFLNHQQESDFFSSLWRSKVPKIDFTTLVGGVPDKYPLTNSTF